MGIYWFACSRIVYLLTITKTLTILKYEIHPRTKVQGFLSQKVDKPLYVFNFTVGKSLMIKSIILSLVHHTGTLNKNHKTKFSYEGDGLSVSIHPEAWVEIANLSGSDFILKKESGVFAEYYNFDRETLIQWGLQDQLIEPCTLYKIEFNDDSDVIRYTLHDDYNEALEEAGGDIDLVEEVDGHRPTEKMTSLIAVKTCHSTFEKHLFGLYVQNNHPEIDGVWFDDNLDVSALSAPCGMIFSHKLDLWSCNKLRGI